MPRFGGSDGTRTAASCVTGRRSNQLNYAPALKNQFPAVTACALLCPRVTKTSQKCRDRAAFIDFGYCFNAAEWSFPDFPLRGAYARQEVYAHVEAWNDFEPWLSRIERYPEANLLSIAQEIPREWYGERHDVYRLVDSLFERRRIVRRLIDNFRASPRNPFPNWKPGPPVATPSAHISELATMISAPG